MEETIDRELQSHESCSCPRVFQLEEEISILQTQLFRYRRKYGNLDLIEQRQSLKGSNDFISDPIPQLLFDDNSTTLVSSTVGRHVVLDYVADSPMFRKNLDALEDSTSGLRGFLKELMIRTKEFVSAGKQMGIKEIALAEIYTSKYSRSLFTSCYAELGDLSVLLNDFHDTLAQIQSSRESLFLSIDALLYKPLETFVEEELKAAPEWKKETTKSGDEYETCLGKSLSKPSPFFSRSASLSDASHGINDISPNDIPSDRPSIQSGDVEKGLTASRCKFELARFDCVHYFNALDAKKKFVLVEALNSTLYSYLGHFHACHELIQSIEPALRTRQAALQEARQHFNRDEAMYTSQRDLLESRLSAYPSHVALPVEVISIGTATSRQETTTEKQGYLFVRNSIFPTKSWKRVWFQIHDGKLYSIRNSKEMELSLVCDLMISKVRPISNALKGLPYCFEILDNNQTKQVLQAASEYDMQSWIDAAQASTERLLGLQESHNHIVDPGQANAINMLIELNPKCADCNQTPAEWVSINLGVFICIECSGIHRSIGVHVSKVRSLVLDKWNMTLLELLQHHLGNRIVNSIWEPILAPGWTKPTPLSSHNEKEKWIRAKYEFRGFNEPTMMNNDDLNRHFLNAALRGDIYELIWSIAHGIDINIKDPINKKTAFQLAKSKGNDLACEYLLQNGAIFNILD